MPIRESAKLGPISAFEANIFVALGCWLRMFLCTFSSFIWYIFSANYRCVSLHAICLQGYWFPVLKPPREIIYKREVQFGQRHANVFCIKVKKQGKTCLWHHLLFFLRKSKDRNWKSPLCIYIFSITENVNLTAGVSICNCDLYMMATKKVFVQCFRLISKSWLNMYHYFGHKC